MIIYLRILQTKPWGVPVTSDYNRSSVLLIPTTCWYGSTTKDTMPLISCIQTHDGLYLFWRTLTPLCSIHKYTVQGRIQDLIRGGAPDRDRPKTAILGPQFCRIFGAGASFLVVGGGPGPRGPPPGSAPAVQQVLLKLTVFRLSSGLDLRKGQLSSCRRGYFFVRSWS